MNNKTSTIITVAMLCAVLYSANVSATSTNHTISTEGSDCYAIDNDGSLWTWTGQCFYNGKSISPTKIEDNVASVHGGYFIKTDSTMWRVKHQNGDFTVSKVADDVAEMSDSYWCTYILRSDNSLWAKGSNYCYGMGKRDTDVTYGDFTKIMNNVSSVSGGWYHTAVLKTDSSLWTFGFNFRGQLGDNSNVDSFKPQKIMSDIYQINTGINATFAFKNDGALWRWGNICADLTDDSQYNITVPVEYTANAVQVCSKCGYNLVLKKNGDLWMYGETDGIINDGYAEFNVIDLPYPLIYDYSYPHKIMDNVAAISDEPLGVSNGPTLILDNTGTVHEMNLQISEDGRKEIRVDRIKDNIRKPVRAESKTPLFLSFTDLTGEDAIDTAVAALSKAGITNGVTDTEFMPDKPITRAETAAVLLRLVGKGDAAESCDYSDVTSDKWYYGAVGASQKYGIISGYDDGTFRGEEPVSDIELAALAARTLRREGTAPDTDEREITLPGSIPSWAAEDIVYAAQNDIITQSQADALSGKPLTRGEAAVMLYSLYNVI